MTTLDPSRRRGFASVLALMFLAVMCSLAVAFFASTNTELKKSENLGHVAAARMEAEGGMAFLSYQLRRHSPQDIRTGQELLDGLAVAMGETMNGSQTLRSASVAYDGNTIVIPSIAATQPGRSFHGTITLVNHKTVLLRVTGVSGNVSRSLGMQFGLLAGGYSASAFDYGIASRGPIRMVGSAQVLGATWDEEGDCLSAVYGEAAAFRLTGGPLIQGDVYASDPDTHVKLCGTNMSIGGEDSSGTKTLPDPDDDHPICDHVHIGVGPVDFPEINSSQFEPFAKNPVDAHTVMPDNTFTNIRILAGSNKTFSGDVKLKGVVFIEVPNDIHFTGNVEITGVIVTEDAGDDADKKNTNRIIFNGNVVSKGVEELDDTDQFCELRKMPGSFLLAPGFSVLFAGNFSTINGCMAAEEFMWTGNAGGIIKGGIIAYGNADLTLTGNSCITIDREGTPAAPSGFRGAGSRLELVQIPSTYIEY